MSLFKSRKFYLMIVDVVVSLTGLMLGWWLAPQEADRIMAVVAIVQPVIISVIIGIAVEDAAEKRAGVYITSDIDE